MDQVHGLYFVRDGKVETEEVIFIKQRDGLSEIFGRDIEAVISPVVKARIGWTQLSNRRVVHGGTYRVLDRVANHSERSAQEF